MKTGFNGHFSAEITVAFGEASAALARAEERLALFPEPDVLVARIRLAEQSALAWLEGELLIPDQLAVDYGFSPRAWRRWPFAFVRAFDRPLNRDRLPDAHSVGQWLSGSAGPAPPALADQPIPIHEDRLAAWEQRTTPLARLPRLIAGADLAAAFARTAPLGFGNLVIGAMLADRHCLPNSRLSAGGIAAIGLQQRHTSWLSLVSGALEDDFDAISETARDERCRRAWLDALTAGAQTAIGLDKRLRIWLAQLEAACQGTRKSSHLKRLALLAGRGPSLTVTRAARDLRISRQAATRLVAQACERHLLREITHGNAFRRYVITA